MVVVLVFVLVLVQLLVLVQIVDVRRRRRRSVPALVHLAGMHRDVRMAPRPPLVVLAVRLPREEQVRADDTPVAVQRNAARKGAGARRRALRAVALDMLGVLRGVRLERVVVRLVQLAELDVDRAALSHADATGAGVALEVFELAQHALLLRIDQPLALAFREVLPKVADALALLGAADREAAAARRRRGARHLRGKHGAVVAVALGRALRQRRPGGRRRGRARRRKGHGQLPGGPRRGRRQGARPRLGQRERRGNRRRRGKPHVVVERRCALFLLLFRLLLGRGLLDVDRLDVVARVLVVEVVVLVELVHEHHRPEPILARDRRGLHAGRREVPAQTVLGQWQVGEHRRVDKHRRVERQGRRVCLVVAARQVPLRRMRGLRELLRDGNHGLRRRVPRQCVGVRARLGEVAERQGVADKRAQVRRQRGPVRLVVGQPGGVRLDAPVQIAGGREQVGLDLRGGRERRRTIVERITRTFRLLLLLLRGVRGEMGYRDTLRIRRRHWPLLHDRCRGVRRARLGHIFVSSRAVLCGAQSVHALSQIGESGSARSKEGKGTPPPLAAAAARGSAEPITTST